MKRYATLGVFCGFATVASAWSIFAGSGAMSSAALMASEAEASVSVVEIAAETAVDSVLETVVEAAVLAPPSFCIKNFSKDDCNGFVEPGNYDTNGCDDVRDCKSIRVTGAVYKADLKSSGQACGIQCESKCDEFPDGTLYLKFDYVLRADSCCPFRGSWVGKWEYKTERGLVYGGDAHGTIGVGTNRKSECLATDDDCERCYDVILDGSKWLVGIEGSFRGVALNSPTRVVDELNFTCDGTWIESVVSNAKPFSEPFRVLNRFDGAFVDYCP